MIRQNVKNRKSCKWIYTLAAVSFVLFLVSVMFFILQLQNASDPASNAVILKAAAKQLNKDPNELTKKDFARITELCIAEKTGQGIGLNTEGYNIAELSDIAILKKFVNLEELDISYLKFPKKTKSKPKWKSYLEKIGINISTEKTQRTDLDLSTLRNLSKLRRLKVQNSPVIDNR